MTLRLRQVALVAADRDRVVADLCAVLDLQVGFHDPQIETLRLHNAVIPVGEEFLEVVAPLVAGITADRYLQRRGGDGGYMLIFQTDDHPPRRRRVEELGVRIVAEFNAHGYTNMQLHPVDTGGTFLEIDHQEGALAWHPAGPDWRQAIRTELCTGIVGATVQCADPASVAERWSQIVEVPVTRVARDDRPSAACLEFDGSIVRFVEPADERGDGLAGVDIAVRSPDEVLHRADERGLERGDEHVMIGGMRIDLIVAR